MWLVATIIRQYISTVLFYVMDARKFFKIAYDLSFANHTHFLVQNQHMW